MELYLKFKRLIEDEARNVVNDVMPHKGNCEYATTLLMESGIDPSDYIDANDLYNNCGNYLLERIDVFDDSQIVALLIIATAIEMENGNIIHLESEGVCND